VGWNLVASVSPSVLFWRVNQKGDVQACAATAKPDEVECRPVAIREVETKPEIKQQ
jgi:hypothetical protein